MHISLKIIFGIFLIIFFTVINLQKSYAEFYFSAGISLSNNTLEIANNGKTELFPSFTINSSQSNKELICSRCIIGDTGSGSSLYLSDVYKVIDRSETADYSVASYKIKNSQTPSYNFALGYMFLNNLRVEGEFKLASFKKNLESLQTKFKVNSNLNSQFSYICDNNNRCPYAEMNYEENYNNNYSVSSDIFSLIPNNGETPNIALSNNINYYFLNALYDIPVMQYFGLFSGVGAGLAAIKLSSQSNISIDLNENSSFYAYQYKLGTYYNPYNSQHLRLMLSFTSIHSIGDVKFNSFNVKPISQNSVDFSLMYIL
ncbi:MAG: hypothetical protein FWE18_02180 [Alphaproteobacteria bacterium]|nr:hypothetical protein [Alphaproteobacteria bacterium]